MRQITLQIGPNDPHMVRVILDDCECTRCTIHEVDRITVKGKGNVPISVFTLASSHDAFVAETNSGIIL